MLPDFRLETHFSKWEFKAEHHLTASDAESMSMRELLDYATPEQRVAFDDFWLGYTETWGAPDLPTPTDRFRIGAGHKGLDEGIAAMTEHLAAKVG